MNLTDEQLLRYSRQIMLPEIDLAGQQKLISAKVLILGAGGLGSPAAIYLAAAGIGNITICDHDNVESSNLQRQILYTEEDVGRPKVSTAKDRLSKISATLNTRVISKKLNEADLKKEISTNDIVLDATDNFDSRYMINRACWETKTPLVSGAAIRWEGQFATFDPRNTESPCYQCLYSQGDDDDLNCSESGVTGPLVGIIGTCQAMEAIKTIIGINTNSLGKIFYLDAKHMEWQQFKLKKDP